MDDPNFVVATPERHALRVRNKDKVRLETEREQTSRYSSIALSSY